MQTNALRGQVVYVYAFDVGAISLQVGVPFEVSVIEDLLGYQLLYQDWSNAWMVVLETTIVLLFILDVILLLLGL